MRFISWSKLQKCLFRRWPEAGSWIWPRSCECVFFVIQQSSALVTRLRFRQCNITPGMPVNYCDRNTLVSILLWIFGTFWPQYSVFGCDLQTDTRRVVQRPTKGAKWCASPQKPVPSLRPFLTSQRNFQWRLRNINREIEPGDKATKL